MGLQKNSRGVRSGDQIGHFGCLFDRFVVVFDELVLSVEVEIPRESKCGGGGGRGD
jgi:hypothetical protein